MAKLTEREQATAFDFVADWHERQARLFLAMANDEPRTGAGARSRAREAHIHHNGSAACLRNRASDIRRAALKESIGESSEQRVVVIDLCASLAAAISLLERTPKAKKAAPSDRMFDQMLSDYRASLERGRAAMAEELK